MAIVFETIEDCICFTLLSLFFYMVVRGAAKFAGRCCRALKSLPLTTVVATADCDPNISAVQDVTRRMDKHTVYADTRCLTGRPRPESIDFVEQLVLVTSRPSKLSEAQQLMPSIRMRHVALQLPTLEHVNSMERLKQTAAYRVLQAFCLLNQACLVEECALHIDLTAPADDNKKTGGNAVSEGTEKWFPGHYHRDVVDALGKREFATLYRGRRAHTYNALAFTSDGIYAHVFTGSMEATVCRPSDVAWIEMDGWDPFLMPKGHTQSMAALAAFKHILNMRQLPLAELLSALRPKYKGVYEIHITVINQDASTRHLWDKADGEVKKYQKGTDDDDGDVGKKKNLQHGNELITNKLLMPSADYLAKFRARCAQLGVKALVIELDHPRKPLQLQTGSYHSFSGYAEAQQYAVQLANQLLQFGLPHRRIRVEGMLHNGDCPRTDVEASRAAERDSYFEFHARLAPCTVSKVKVKSVRSSSTPRSCSSSPQHQQTCYRLTGNDNFVDSSNSGSSTGKTMQVVIVKDKKDKDDDGEEEATDSDTEKEKQSVARSVSVDNVLHHILQQHYSERAGAHQRGRFIPKISKGGGRLFMNARVYLLGSETALLLWHRLKTDVEQHGFVIAKEVKPERCLYDDDPTMDDRLI